MAGPRTTKMQYVRLGNSGLKISKIVVGCMSYGDKMWANWVVEEEEAMEHIKAAFDMGLNTFDTADAYSNGLSERILGKAIKKYAIPREELVILTKLWSCISTGDMGERLFEDSTDSLNEKGYINQYGLSRKHIFDAVKHSLERLELDYIDVLQCHRFDPDTPIEETMQALHDVVKAGYVRYIGMSSCYAYQFHAMQDYAITHNLTPFIAMQNHYSLLYREEEREMFPTLKHFGVGSLPWSPLARGMLTRPLSEETTRAKVDVFQKEYHKQESISVIVKRVEEVAEKRGLTMAQVALAWVLSRPGVTAPIVGTTSVQNMKELVAAVEIELSKEEKEYLQEAYLPQPILGHK